MLQMSFLQTMVITASGFLILPLAVVVCLTTDSLIDLFIIHAPYRISYNIEVQVNCQKHAIITD
jgi:hypothetical protein